MSWAARAVVPLAFLAAMGCSKATPPPPGDEEVELFHNACARCHGIDGTGGPPDSLGHPGPRNFTDPLFQRARTDGEIRKAILDGNRGMPAFGPVFTSKQVDLLVAHVRKFAFAMEKDGAATPTASAPGRPR